MKGQKTSKEWYSQILFTPCSGTEISIRIEVQISERKNINFMECTMSLLLSMAFSDNAFKGISTYKQLFDIRPVDKNTIKTIP